MQKNRKLIIALYFAVSLSLVGLLFFCLSHFNFVDLKEPNNKKTTWFHQANPASLEFYEETYGFNKYNFDLSKQQVIAGVIPHHLLAADLIADFFRNLEGKQYDIVFLLGPDHFMTAKSSFVTSVLNWQTPYGVLYCNNDVAQDLVDNFGLTIQEDVFYNEHSISSEVAFIKKTFPQATFVPIVISSGVDSRQATKLAEALVEISKQKKILVLASTDFSHYKTSQQAIHDDKLSIVTINNFDFSKVYFMQVDSRPAIYILMKYSQLNQSVFKLLVNSNSAILSNQPNLESTTSYILGYFIK